MRRQPYPYTELTKGMNVNIDAIYLTDQQSPNVKHIFYDKKVIAKEFDWKVFGSVDERPMLIDTFYKRDGSEYLIVLTVDQAYQYSAGVFSGITGSDVFTGDEDDPFSTCIAYNPDDSDDIYIVTNGIDHIQKWDGTTWTDLLGIQTDVTCTAAKCCVLFYNHVVLGYTTESGNAIPYRIRWSDTGYPEEWDDTTSNAGYFDLSDTVDWIVKLELMKDRCFVFKEKSIWELLYVGGTDIFEARMVVDGIGTYAPHSVINMGEYILFYGSDNVYSFDGTHLTELGNNLFPLFYSTGDKIVNEAKLNRSAAIYVEETRHYVLCLPTSGSEPDWLLKYDIREDAWTQADVEATCFGYYTASSQTAWSSATGTWLDLEYQVPWRYSSLPEGAPTTLRGTSDGTIWEDDRTVKGDWIQWQSEERAFGAIEETWSEIVENKQLVWESKDMIFGHAHRIIEYHMVVMGDAFYVSHSTDNGDSWSAETLLTPSSTEYREMVYYLNETTQVIRFRIRSSEDEFKMKWAEPWYVPRVRSKEVYQS